MVFQKSFWRKNQLQFFPTVWEVENWERDFVAGFFYTRNSEWGDINFQKFPKLLPAKL